MNLFLYIRRWFSLELHRGIPSCPTSNKNAEKIKIIQLQAAYKRVYENQTRLAQK
jgi:hypothetical protein